MNQHLQNVLNIVQNGESLTVEQTVAISKSLKDADKELEKTAFKLDSTERVKRTTAILLEETIEELEQKRRTFEAQNHKLEIEAALERTRTQSMLMQHSKELDDTLRGFHEQVLLLGINSAFSFLWLPDEEKDRHIFWAAWAENQASANVAKNEATIFKSKAINYPLDRNDPATAQCLIDWKSNEPVYSYAVPPEGVENYFAAWKELIEGVEKLTPEHFTGGLYYVEAFMKYGCFGVMTAIDLTEDQKKILGRFAIEFERAYTRFLDLQKAEAQAKEAQIQLALERVRARTMAMQHSEELAEVASLLFKQIENSGTKQWATGFDIWQADKVSATAWMSNPDGSVARPFVVPFTEDPFFKQIYEARKSGNDFFVMESDSIELEETYKYMFTIPDAKKYFDEIVSLGFQIPTFQITHCVFFSQGFLMFITHEPVPEMWDIFKRFAKVFEQTYTRFLDLKKAEEQTRESQIQLAMERVRARTMAMQRSEELAEVATVLFQQVKALGVPQWLCGFSIWEIGDKEFTWYPGSPDGDILPPSKIPLTEHPVFISFDESRRRGDELFVYEKEGEFQADHYRYMLSLPGTRELLQNMLDAGLTFPTFQIDHIANFSHGNLAFITYEHFPEMHDVFKRFAKVFEQTYIRFLDLQKTEAQVREAKIEAALERVRSRTMAMHNSEDVTSTTETMFDEFKNLGIDNLRCGVANVHHNRTFDVFGVTNLVGGNKMSGFGLFGMDEHPIWQRWFASWNNKEEVFIAYIAGQEKEEYFNIINNHPNYLPQRIVNFPDNYFQAYYFEQGAVWAYSLLPHSDPEKDIMKRFTTGFSLTYRRYQDLKKAEAQARESQIQLALERIRARTMAMQKSDELREVVFDFFNQMYPLGFAQWGFALMLADEAQQGFIFWLSAPGGRVLPESYFLPKLDHRASELLWSVYNNQLPVSYLELKDGEKLSWDLLLFEKSGLGRLPESVKEEMLAIPYVVGSLVSMKYGLMEAIDVNPLPEELISVLQRFAKVFEQTYTRFLDLQKAEAQAREAQIEAALERVRGKTMGMQKSEELKDVIQVVYEQFVHLNILIEHTGFIMDYKARDDMDIWLADRHEVPSNVTIPYFDCAHWNSFNEAKEKGMDFFANHLPFEEKNRFYQDLFKLIPGLPDEAKEYYFSCPGLAISTVLLENVGLYIENFSGTAYSEEENATLMRFGKVFQQTYTRFLDLQKAEAQAREAQLETALEKVRSRSLAMHQSDELEEVIMVVSEQLLQLQFRFHNVSFSSTNEQLETTFWLATPGRPHPFLIQLPYFGTAMLTRVFYARKNGIDFFADTLTAEENQEWLQHLVYKSRNSFTEDDKKFLLTLKGLARSTVLTKHIILAIINYAIVPYSEEQNIILKRFGNVFEQAYTRFIDLQKAEAQGREAIKRASVDRVRAEIASMRTTSDLERIQPLIWNELTTLGVPFIRCGVFIMDEEKQEVRTLLSTPEGQAIATLHVPFEFDLSIITNGVQYWRKKKVYTEHWDAAAFTKAWSKLSSLRETSMESQQTEHPPENLHLHMLPFLQGMLYVGSNAPLNDEELQLVQNLADAFSTAYARYEDFNKLESANVKIEKTLVDLKQTQAQLVQSEKMASLGELTAGIAHEIQNPLNFVNNFSEVSNELIDEMNDEIEKGDMEEAKAIANDIKQNLEKILHHGKRADGIVKGMLQHSRSSSATKEPTDINKLADEYLRLAYHGLRAKDKSFNVALKTDFDETIGNINIIPQDIGRAVLNLINNAFYVVDEKKKQAAGLPTFQRLATLYEPTVSISTKKVGDKVEIKVKDNGNGIPQKVLDKIFQPFFTTKPAGQGTGLGLSLSYDIIKAHGGEIRVETKEGEGTEFIIHLPTF